MSETIAKNTKKAKRAIDNACNIRCYSLSNNFSGAPLTDSPVRWDSKGSLEHVSQVEFLRGELEMRHAKLSVSESGKFTLHIHSNLWYETDLAHVLIHELGHTAGLKHRDMNCPVYSRVGNWREIHSWGESLPLEKAVAVKPTLDSKLSHAQAMLRKAISREKRAATLRKKWQRRVKRYQADAALVMLPMVAQSATERGEG